MRSLAKIHRPLIWLSVFVGLWFGWRTAEPWVYIEFLPHGNNADRLAALGPRAIGPIIMKVKNETPWSKSTALLPTVLGKIGEPAHQQLLIAIDEEKDPFARISYIYCLQAAFNDFSRVPLWLDHVKRFSATSSNLKSQLIMCQIENEEKIDVEKLSELIPAHLKTNPNEIVILVPEILRWSSQNGDDRNFNPAFLKWYTLMSKPGGPLPPWSPDGHYVLN